MNTKQNVFVPVGSQHEAERMEKVLRAMGVKICKGIYFETDREDYPCVLGFDSVDGEALLCHLKHRIALRAQITFGELIDILSKPKEVAVDLDAHDLVAMCSKENVSIEYKKGKGNAIIISSEKIQSIAKAMEDLK